MFYKANAAICNQVCRNWNAFTQNEGDDDDAKYAETEMTTISRWSDDDDVKYAETQCSAALIPFQGPIKLQSEHSP